MKSIYIDNISPSPSPKCLRSESEIGSSLRANEQERSGKWEVGRKRKDLVEGNVIPDLVRIPVEALVSLDLWTMLAFRVNERARGGRGEKRISTRPSNIDHRPSTTSVGGMIEGHPSPGPPSPSKSKSK
jgi:hypothetical protein